MKKRMGRITSGLFVCMVTLASSSALAQQATWSATPDPEPRVEEGIDGFDLQISSEFGLASVLYHKIQQGESGTYFDYKADGGQELFQPFLRLGADAVFGGRHQVTLLYQPLQLKSRVRLQDTITVYDKEFPEGKTMDLTYGFDFYRATYAFDLFASEKVDLALGGGFQMRNAAVLFTPTDGSEGRINRNIGPVPLLKLRARYNFDSGYWVGSEIDGFYARIRIINGDTNSDIMGAVYDANLRAGATLADGLDAFLNVRFLGGGSEGTDTDDTDPTSDGYTKNWLHLTTVSLGFYFDPLLLAR